MPKMRSDRWTPFRPPAWHFTQRHLDQQFDEIETGHESAHRLDQCPVSEVRDTWRHSLTRTSETNGHWQAYDSSAAFRFEVPEQHCGRRCRNFKSAALVAGSVDIPRIFPLVWQNIVDRERTVPREPLADPCQMAAHARAAYALLDRVSARNAGHDHRRVSQSNGRGRTP